MNDSPSEHAISGLKEKQNQKQAKKWKEAVAMPGWFAVERLQCSDIQFFLHLLFPNTRRN